MPRHLGRNLYVGALACTQVSEYLLALVPRWYLETFELTVGYACARGMDDGSKRSGLALSRAFSNIEQFTFNSAYIYLTCMSKISLPIKGTFPKEHTKKQLQTRTQTEHGQSP